MKVRVRLNLILRIYIFEIGRVYDCVAVVTSDDRGGENLLTWRPRMLFDAQTSQTKSSLERRG